MVLVGPSGCGKSTTLRMLAGLEEVNEGKIFIGDRDITNLPPKDRDIAMVFQNYALYPHMTVGGQHGLRAEDGQGAQGRGAQEAGRARRPRSWTSRTTWSASPRRSRVVSASASRWAGRSSAARRCSAWTSRCRTWTRRCGSQTRTDIAKLQADLGVTTVYVTHDQVEAMTMGDRVAVMKLGELQQVDTPLKLYDKPVNLFVAGFIGSPADEPAQGQGRRGPGQDRRLPGPGRPDRVEEDAAATSPSASAPRPGGWCPTPRVACRSRSPWSRSSAPTSSSTAPVTSRARPATSSSGSAARDTVHKGDTIYVTTDPHQRARLRHRHRRAPLRLI